MDRYNQICSSEMGEFFWSQDKRRVRPSWDKLNMLKHTVRDVNYITADGLPVREGILQINYRRNNLIRGPLLGPETTHAINTILINDIKQFLTESGFRYQPWYILSNRTFSSLVATYVYINGPDSWIDICRELGVPVPLNVDTQADRDYLDRDEYYYSTQDNYNSTNFYRDPSEGTPDYDSTYGIGDFICSNDMMHLITQMPNRPRFATWYQVKHLNNIIREIRWDIPAGMTRDNNMLQGILISPPIEGSLLGPETTDAINRILINDVKQHFTEKGFPFSPLYILRNDAFSFLVATYIFINGPESWRVLGRAVGAFIPDLIPPAPEEVQLPPNNQSTHKGRGGGRKKNRTKKSSRRHRRRSRRR